MRQVWTYTARDHKGAQVRGEIESDSREHALETISDRGLIPIKVSNRKGSFTFSGLFGSITSAHREKLIIFTKNLKTLHRAGIPLLRALSIVERGSKELGFESEIKSISSDLRAGQPLSTALSRFPKKFPPIYVNSIAAGEASGTLDQVFDQLSILIEKELVLSRQIKSAFRYPVMVISALAVAIFILMSFVVPQFAKLYGKFDAGLPLPTKIVMTISGFFSSYWYLILLGAIIGAILFLRLINTDRGRKIWDKAILRVPLFGSLIIKAHIARFASMLTILFRSGVPMISCLNILKITAGNTAIAADIRTMATSFEQGREIGQRRDDYKYMPHIALEMLDVGLESGAIESIMQELATHYEMELDYRTRHLTAMLEPILIVFIGAMVLCLALAIFLPMWNLIHVFR